MDGFHPFLPLNPHHPTPTGDTWAGGLKKQFPCSYNLSLPCAFRLLLPAACLCSIAALTAAEPPEPITFVVTPVAEHCFILTEKGFLNARPFKSIQAYSDDLAAVQDRESNLWGFVDRTGNLTLPFQWRVVGSFDSESHLAVAQDEATGHYGYINRQGLWAISAQWDFCSNMTGAGAASVKKGRKWGLIDRGGNTVVEPQWDESGSILSTGPALIPFRQGTKWGYVNGQGKTVIPPRFDAAKGFVDCGLARIRLGAEWGFIDASGTTVIPPKWTEVLPFFGIPGSGRAAVKDSKGKWGFISENGTIVVPPRYDAVEKPTSDHSGPFTRGRAMVQKAELWGLLGVDGTELIPCEHESMELAGQGKVTLGNRTPAGWRYCLADERGRALMPMELLAISVDDTNGSWCTVMTTPGGKDYKLHRGDDGLVGTFHLDVDFPPPAKPMLRIETGMHTVEIKGIATDRLGRLVLTCSYDKTARLWKLEAPSTPEAFKGAPTPRATLLHTLRPPISTGGEGKLSGCALSPDGKIAALGGGSGYAWDGECSIYLFDTTTGSLVRRCTGIQNALTVLAFSPDGTRLAAGSFSGLRVFTSASASLEAEDRDYGASINGVDWVDDRTLVTSCGDGMLRRYTLPTSVTPSSEATLTPSHKVVTTVGKTPFKVRFSPNGKFLAVCFFNSNRITLHDAGTLAPLKAQPDCESVTNGLSLSSVAWSADGSILAAAGNWWDAESGNTLLRLWKTSHLSEYRDVPLSKGAISGLASLPNAGLLFASVDPTWGAVSLGNGSEEKLRRYTLGSSPIARYRCAHGNFRLSADATQVAFAFLARGDEVARFDLRQRRLSLGSGGSSGLLHSPRQERGDIEITDWHDNQMPKLNGRLLPLEANEYSYCYAIDQPGSGFVLGASWSLRGFDPQGWQRWEQSAPGAVHAVNLSEMGKIAVAGYGDGTIRWHRNDLQGQEVLAFFPHADRKRWVMWTPEGYYDCSAEGESLIGWHVNRGKAEAADYFPASKFRDQFYRPDIIGQLLDTWDIKEAVRRADEKAGTKPTTVASSTEVIATKQPPVVLLIGGGALDEIEVPPGVSTVSFRYQVRRGTGAEVTRVWLQLDGRPLETALAIPTSDTQELSATVTVPPDRDCMLSLLAENQYAPSVTSTLRVRRALSPPPPSPTAIPAVLKPNLYILSVGVSDYSDASGLRDLGLAAKDARDFATAFSAQEGLLYQKVIPKVLCDADATETKIKDGLDWVRQQTTAKDVCAIFLAGHGFNDSKFRYFFCPHDFDPVRKLSSKVGSEAILDTVSSLPGKVLFFIDTCHAGNALGKMAIARDVSMESDIDLIVAELSNDENGAVVFSSSTGRQLSLENAEWGNGAFTKAVVEGLGGKGDVLGNGKITIASLEVYVAERVKTLTGGEQTPTVTKPNSVPDFTISVKR